MQTTIALTSAFFAAIYFVYTSYVMKNTKGVSSGLTLWVGHLLAALMLLPFWYFYSPVPAVFILESRLLLPLMATTLLLVISRELYYYAYARTDVANITVFSALTPVYTLATGYVLLGEIPNTPALSGLLLICGSIYFLFLKSSQKSGVLNFIFRPFVYIVSSRPIFYAFLSTIPTAFAAVYQKTLLQDMDPIGLSFFMLLLIGVFALCITIANTPAASIKKQLASLPTHFYVVSAVMLPLVHVLFCMVMLTQQTAISLALQRTAIVFQIILAYYFLREHTNIKKRLAVGACVTLGFWLIMWQGCSGAACAKQSNAWFKERYDPSIELFITPENGDLFFNKITDPTQQEAAKEIIATLATRQTTPKPAGKITCAVVGNSGNLLHSGYGKNIDAHSYVFRMNSAPVQGYEQDVGARTTHHVAHSNTASFRDYGAEVQNYMVVADQGWQYYDESGKAGYSDSVAIKIKLLIDQVYPSKFPKTIQPQEPFLEGTHFPNNASSLTGNLFIVKPFFLFYIYDKWFDPNARKTKTFPSIGLKTLILSFHICDEVDVFGFGANHKTGRWDHYYNQGYLLTGPPSVHKWDYQEEFLKRLAKENIIKFYGGN